MAKRKRTKEQTMIYKTPHRKRTSNTNLTKNQGWTGRASSSRSTSGIRRSLVINSVINYKWRFDTKGKSEAVNRRRTDNTMAKRKSTRTNNDLQNTTHKTNDRATRTPLKTKAELRCCRMITFPALHLTHVSCYNGQKKKDKHWSIKHYTENLISSNTISWLLHFLNLLIHIILSLPAASLNHVLFRGKDSWLHVLSIK